MSKRYWMRKDGAFFVSGCYYWKIGHIINEPDATGAVRLYSPCGYSCITLKLAELRECDQDGNPLSLDSGITAPNPKRHPHADLIHAWAEGAEIEWLNVYGKWVVVPYPIFIPEQQYRIKSDLSKERAELAEVEQQVSKLQSELKQRMEELEPLIDKRDALREVVANG